MNCHEFADDPQLYCRWSVKDIVIRVFLVNTIEKLHSKCSILDDCEQIKLKLNEAKTEVMVVASFHNQCCLKDISAV